MKKISVCIGCFNEEGNVYEMYKAVTDELNQFKGIYDYEIIFSDNDSKDRTKEILRKIAGKDRHVKVIFNTRNFGAEKSAWNCLVQADGDAVINMVCDFQAPPELISKAVHMWENGSLLVLGKKTESMESKWMFFIRRCYYKVLNLMSEYPQFDNVSGFGLMDRRIMDAVKDAYEPDVGWRYLLAELGYKPDLLTYVQPVRKAGKSSYSIRTYLVYALDSIVNTSRVPVRLATASGIILAGVSSVFGAASLVKRLLGRRTDRMELGVLGLSFISALQLFFIGIVGEYTTAVLTRIHRAPSVVEEEKINFGE